MRNRPITLASNTSIGAVGGTQLTVTGLVQDPSPSPVPAADLHKAGAGTVVFPTANTYGGRTIVELKITWKKGHTLVPDWTLAEGHVITVEGRMVERLHLAMAERVVSISEAIAR